MFKLGDEQFLCRPNPATALFLLQCLFPSCYLDSFSVWKTAELQLGAAELELGAA